MISLEGLSNHSTDGKERTEKASPCPLCKEFFTSTSFLVSVLLHSLG